MRTTAKLVIIIFNIILIGYGCGKTDKRTDAEIEKLIERNKDKALFLDFWEGINDTDLIRVKEIETIKGNLKDGIFVLKIPSDYRDFLEFPFEIIAEYPKILLIFKEEKWINNSRSDKDYINQAGKDEGEKFKHLEEFLIKTFDEKYERCSKEYFVWKTQDNKIIGLDVNYNYVSSDEYAFMLYNNDKNTMKKNENHYFSDFLATQIYNNKNGPINSCLTKGNKMKVAECHIEVTYLKEDKLPEVKKNAEEIINSSQRGISDFEKEKKEKFDSQIEKSKSKL